MERILEWILKLEEELDKQDDTIPNDLKIIKEQFQNHEVIRRKFSRFFFLNVFFKGIYDWFNTRSKSNW